MGCNCHNDDNHNHAHHHHAEGGCCGGHGHAHTHTDEDCGCGGHEHEHGSGGCCGGHNHADGCGCGGSSSEGSIKITQGEFYMLMILAETPFLPLARFVMNSTKSDELQSIALAPVFLQEIDDTMEHVRVSGEILLALEGKGLVTLDYDQPLKGYTYSEYTNSEIYKSFKDTVAEGAQRGDFLFDTADIELGSFALTMLGQYAVEYLQSIG